MYRNNSRSVDKNGSVVFKLLVWFGAEGYVSGLQYAAVVPETC